MDFAGAESFAKKWAATASTRFELIDVDHSAKKLTFASPSSDDSFYVVGPNRDSGAVLWHVWSDNENVLTRLHLIIDSLQSCREKSLNEILTSVNKALAGSAGGAAALEAEDDDVDEGLDDDDDDYDDDDDDDYYGDDDLDAIAESGSKQTTENNEEDARYAKQGSVTAVKRLLKDWKSLKDLDKFSITACPRGDNLFVWDVKLKDFPKDSRLGKDLHEYSKKYRTEPVIYMEMLFPEAYPMAPPFVRILKPRFKFLTGHVTIGGSICMELLTKSGWRPTNDIENLLVQIRSEIMSDKDASLDQRNTNSPYDKVEAERAFHRMVQKYGWNS